jgi:EmrB/QacA subfamily drug resistance transporter
VTEAQPDIRKWAALIVCSSALFMTLLDVSVTNVALPSISRATGAGPSQLQWILSGYTLSFGLVPVLAGRLGDDHGRRLLFQIGISGFVATSVLAGLSPTPSWLIVARVLQGLSGGLINPQVSGLIQQMFHGRDRGRAFGVIGTTVGLGTALGPLVGGALIALGGPEHGWRLVFFINVPIGLAVLLLSRRYLPVSVKRGSHRLDVVGALLLGAATLSVLMAAVEYDRLKDLRLIWLVVPAALFLLAFLRRERRLTALDRDPLIDLRLFRNPTFTSGVVFALAFFPVIAGVPLVMALYYQQGLGYSALQSGLGVTPFAIGNAIAAPIAGRYVVRVGRVMIVGASLAYGVGALLLAVAVLHAPMSSTALFLAPPLFVMGLAAGTIITPNQTLTLHEVDPVMGSTAGGALQTAQRIGLALGQAFVGAVFFAALQVGGGTSSRYAHGLMFAMLAVVGFASLSLIVGSYDLIRSRGRGGTHAGHRDG